MSPDARRHAAEAPIADSPPLLEAAGIVKTFGRHRALDDAQLSVRAGSVRGLVGENGAGKSTLGKILSGVMRPDAGVLKVRGKPLTLPSPAAALHAGVTIMQQELSLALDLSVRENVLLGLHPARLGIVSRRRLRRAYDDLLLRTGFELDGEVRVGDLPLAKQQEVEILRALARGAQVIIMDEPTASLSAQDGQTLHAVVRSLRDSSIAIIYISHFLEEVLALSDEVTIMRNGRHVRTLPAAGTTVETLVEGMLGRSHDTNFPPRPPVPERAPKVLEVRDLRQRGQREGVDLAVRAGEVLGLFGLVGSGRSELVHALFGASGGVTGEILLDGELSELSSPSEALAAGVALLPENRKVQGLCLGLTQRRNATLNYLRDFSMGGVVRAARERRTAVSELEAMGVSPVSLNGETDVLSGGNQQKVLFAKTLLRRPRLLILDEPTRGVDVGARRAIYDIVAELVAGGMAVILISSEYEEVANMSHRLCVMREGRIVAEFRAGEASHEVALAAAFGVSAAAAFVKEVA